MNKQVHCAPGAAAQHVTKFLVRTLQKPSQHLSYRTAVTQLWCRPLKDGAEKQNIKETQVSSHISIHSVKVLQESTEEYPPSHAYS